MAALLCGTIIRLSAKFDHSATNHCSFRRALRVSEADPRRLDNPCARRYRDSRRRQRGWRYHQQKSDSEHNALINIFFTNADSAKEG